MEILDDDQLEIIETTDGYKTKVKTAEQLRAAINWIIKHGQFLKINGIVLDGFTASGMHQILKALNSENQAKFLAVGINKGLFSMTNLTYKLLKSK